MAVRDIRRFGCVVFGEPHYPEIWLRIDQGSAPSVSVTGARNDKDKERILSLLEEIWQDDSWLPAA